MATDTAMIDMDIDIDYSMDDQAALERMQAEAAAMQATSVHTADGMNGIEAAAEEGEVDQNEIVPKIHVRGVDSLSTQDVENFATEHYSADLLTRVQWVDDTSANLVYDTEVAAAEALIALSAEERSDPLELRPAKRLTTHPNVELFIRQAVEADVKVKDARLQSRYYLFNSEDPENPHGNRFGKRRFGDRGYRARDYSNKRRRHDIGDEMYGRRGSNGDAFDENLYDDDPASLAARQHRSTDRSSADNEKRVRSGEELFPAKANGRLRDRSASPERDGDGRFGFDDTQPKRQTARPRSRTPTEQRVKNNREARDLLTKELFPDKKVVNGATEARMPKSSPPKTPRELFPSHKRQEARDIDQEYRKVETKLGRYSLDGGDERGACNRSDSWRKDSPVGGDLFARISGGPRTAKNYGRLRDAPSILPDTGDFSFKGAGDGDSGFSILGASNGQTKPSSLPKELFPLKSGGRGNGKDLFDGIIKGRGSNRRRAEDFV